MGIGDSFGWNGQRGPLREGCRVKTPLNRQSQECRDGCAERLERGDSKPEGPKVGTNLACPKTKASPCDCLTDVTVVIKHPADVK